MTIRLAVDNTAKRPLRSVESFLREAVTLSAADLARWTNEAKSRCEGDSEAAKKWNDIRLAFTGIGYARFGLNFSRALLEIEAKAQKES